MGSRLSRQSSLEEEGAAGEEANGGKAEGGRGDFHLSSLLLHPQRLPGVLRKASPAPYVRRVGWLREIQATIREHKREHAVHILRLLRKVSAAGWAALGWAGRAQPCRAEPSRAATSGDARAGAGGGGQQPEPPPQPPGARLFVLPGGSRPLSGTGVGSGAAQPPGKGVPEPQPHPASTAPQGKAAGHPTATGPPAQAGWPRAGSGCSRDGVGEAAWDSPGWEERERGQCISGSLLLSAAIRGQRRQRADSLVPK